MNCRTYPGADCDTDHQLLVATLKVRLANRQRQHSIPLSLEQLKDERAVQYPSQVTNRFTALEAAQVMACDGKIISFGVPYLKNDRLASLTIGGANTSAHDFSSEHGSVSSGDDLDRIEDSSQ